MSKQITAITLLTKHVTRKDRVLLVNPPVQETRYSWLCWNQPLDLLKIGSHLRSNVGCNVELFDMMKPDRAGDVPFSALPRSSRYCTVNGERYPMRRYGQPFDGLERRLVDSQRSGNKPPTQVWITSLCSYWYEGVAETCRIVRKVLPDCSIVLVGNYARLMPDHAAERCPADFVVTKPLALDETVSAIDLYGVERPSFMAVRLGSRVAVDEITKAVEIGITRIAFFNDDIGQHGGESLVEVIHKTADLHRNLRFHLICGLDPRSITRAFAKKLAHAKVAEIHFEHAHDAEGKCDTEAYTRARCYLEEARLSENRLSGFVWIGRPLENLETLIANFVTVLETCGSLIAKPYSPTPGSAEHHAHSAYLAAIPHRHWSPHFFPFAELNGITREEYHDLYRLAAFLNEKVRGRAFDMLNGTLGAQMLRESLKREVWNLEPSSFSVVDQSSDL